MNLTTCFSGAHFTDRAKDARFKPHPLLMLLIFVGVFIGTQIIMGIPLGIAQIAIMIMSGGVNAGGADGSIEITLADGSGDFMMWSMAAQLVLTVIPALLVILYSYLTERRSLESMGIKKKSCVKYYALGLIIGAAMFAASVGICCAAGAAKYTDTDIYNGAAFAVICLAWLIQGAEEEILCRGWFMSWLSSRMPIWAAALINSAFFALLHIFNPGFNVIVFVNLTLFGVFMSVTALRFDSLIPCCALHSVWNMVQGNVFGLPVSGMPALPSVWRFTLADGKELWTGGTFGIEGSLCATIVLVLMTAAMLLVPKKTSVKEA